MPKTFRKSPPSGPIPTDYGPDWRTPVPPRADAAAVPAAVRRGTPQAPRRAGSAPGARPERASGERLGDHPADVADELHQQRLCPQHHRPARSAERRLAPLLALRTPRERKAARGEPVVRARRAQPGARARPQVVPGHRTAPGSPAGPQTDGPTGSRPAGDRVGRRATSGRRSNTVLGSMLDFSPPFVHEPERVLDRRTVHRWLATNDQWEWVERILLTIADELPVRTRRSDPELGLERVLQRRADRVAGHSPRLVLAPVRLEELPDERRRPSSPAAARSAAVSRIRRAWR